MAGDIMGFQQAVQSVFSKYFQFSDRAPRSEYWYWVLFLFVGGFLISLADSFVFGAGKPLSTVFTLATFIPGIAVAVRRLHDTGRTGWLLLIGLIPLLGFVLLLIWFCTRGEDGTNDFGHDPLNPRL